MQVNSMMFWTEAAPTLLLIRWKTYKLHTRILGVHLFWNLMAPLHQKNVAHYWR